MSLTLLLVTVVVFSFVVGRLLTRYVSRHIGLHGAEYMLVGVLIGPYFPWQLIAPESMARLDPLISLLLGLVGFVVGMRAPRRTSGMESRVVGAVSSLLVIFAFAVAAIPLLQWLAPIDESRSDFLWTLPWLHYGGWVLELHVASEHLFVALGLGCAACVCSPLPIAAMRRMAGRTGPIGDLLEDTARASQIISVLGLGLVLAMVRASDHSPALSLSLTEWTLAAVGFGVNCGVLFGLFVAKEHDPSRIFLATIGLVTFAAGIGAALELSPVFVTMLAAITLSVTSAHAETVRTELVRLQHPLFVLMMIFAGALWIPAHGLQWILPFAYLVLRYVLRRILTSLAARAAIEEPIDTRRLADGLLAQGTLAVAIAIVVAQTFKDFSSVVLTTVLIGVLLGDLFAWRSLHGVLVDASELDAGELKGKLGDFEEESLS